MLNRHAGLVLSIALAASMSGLARAADSPPAPPRGGVDAAKAKARELEKQRLIAKLHAEVPKQSEPVPGVNPLAEPIFHRYDRP